MMTTLAIAALALGSTASPAPMTETYTVAEARVSHYGGWPSANDTFGLAGSWVYTTNGFETNSFGYVDACYVATNALNCSVGSSYFSPPEYLDYNNDITVEFRVDYVTNTSSLPSSAGAVFDRRYRLDAEALGGGTWDTNVQTWEPSLANCGVSTGYYSNTSGYVDLATINALSSGSWVNDSPGHYHKWFRVPAQSGDIGDIESEYISGSVAGSPTTSINLMLNTTGKWFYRITKIGSIDLQPEY